MSIPTLVVGIGGTGVYTLRALKHLWREMEQTERVDCKFLAFDFDRSALMSTSNGSLNGFHSPANETSTSQEDVPLDTLDDDEFFYLYPKPIQDLLKNLDRSYEGKRAWEEILDWFPDPDSLRIPTSEVEANG